MSTKIARIRIELEHIAPLIWRCVDVSLTTNLCALHEIIQAVMPWENYHLYQFAVGECVYGEPDPEDAVWGRKIYQAKGMRLGTLVDRGVTELLYTYDFGDDWQHRVIVEEVIEATPGTDYPLFIDGERTAPPEDVGGPPGFMDFVEAMAKTRHPQRKDLVRWYGGPFNPVDFGADRIAESIRSIAQKRKAALEALERSRAKRLH
ncbi:hypothetical protein B9057_03920 [Aestuarium zhoushanense]|nr:hypothetical protein B9057_03920 [Aestuarium zhoushanense]MBE1295457.1 plasmid pRiA4b ORF-3 family protein [Paracoccaceae bacterium]